MRNKKGWEGRRRGRERETEKLLAYITKGVAVNRACRTSP